MYQTFEAGGRPEQGPPRLERLRAELARRGIDGVFVPRADAWQGEYVAPCDERLSWLTGFTGSAGFAVVLPDIAGVFIDGRYRVQVRAEVADAFTPVPWPETKPGAWLASHAKAGAVIGFDPWLHSVDEIAALRRALEAPGISLTAISNPVDAIWDDRPAPPEAPFFAYPTEMAGAHHDAKRGDLSAGLRQAGHRAAILTLPDSIAWLLNIRGADIPRNPVPQAFAILHDDGRCDLFCRPGKAENLRDHLGPDVAVLPQEAFLAALGHLSGPVRIDPGSCPQIVADRLREAEVAAIHDSDPCILPKARKTEAEIAGSRAAHLRDAVAMVEFLAWLDAEAPGGGLTEIGVVTALERFRRGTNLLRDVSFDTIAGAGSHGAIVHYRVTEETDRAIGMGDLLLVDSGGQYLDGTTDITRTVINGQPDADQALSFTRVLQGMIAVSRARFPRGLAGRDLDALARAPLWSLGRDYDHGTGHGVGVYLCVHEGPQRISRKSEVPLEPGMILSNEPGYYREGAWGIRIENLIVVRPAEPLEGADARDMLEFETLTWVPVDRRLIRVDLLSGDERDWINRYHADTLARVGPQVGAAARAWLEAACAPL